MGWWSSGLTGALSRVQLDLGVVLGPARVVLVEQILRVVVFGAARVLPVSRTLKEDMDREVVFLPRGEQQCGTDLRGQLSAPRLYVN